MFRPVLRVAALLILGLVLSACGSRPREIDLTRVFEVRAVAVTANGDVPARVISGIQRQMRLAIEATSHAVPMPRAVMNIHIVRITREGGRASGRAQAEVNVSLSDVETGQTVLARNYAILALSERGRVSDAAIAGSIVARLRYEFGLSTPSIRPLRHDPRLSTRLKADPDAVDPRAQKPLIVPLKTAPALGVDQDPVLNSKTKVDAVKEPARVEPALKPVERQPKENALESGAKTKVVIKPKATAPMDDDEPCVETLDNKC